MSSVLWMRRDAPASRREGGRPMEAEGGGSSWLADWRLELRTLDQVPGLWLKVEGSGSNASAFCREPRMPGLNVSESFQWSVSKRAGLVSLFHIHLPV